jgi:DNA-binding CsgD family transcriptional regulator
MDGHASHAAREADLIGRGADRQRIVACLDDTPGVVAILLVGDAGIGKTALWDWAGTRAEAAGSTVLVSRAAAAEARLPWVGLTDLLAGLPPGLSDELPPPQRRALEVVTLHAVAEEPPDERSVGTALWTALTLMAQSRPVLIAIDDLPFLDAASSAALRFALRRVEPAARVKIVATARSTQPYEPVPVDIVVPQFLTTVRVGPMPADALSEVIVRKLGVRLARPLVLRVHDTSGGNPLYALELARALATLEIAHAPGTPLPVPASLTELVEGRIRTLPGEILDIVAGTAAAWPFTGAGIDPSALAAAVTAGVVTVDGDVVRPAHPLLGAAAYAALSAAHRRALHARLAAATDDPVARARHTALAATSPDAAVARALDTGALAALAAGTPDIAAEMVQLALEHTPDHQDRAVRLDMLADALMRTGDTAGARDAAAQSAALTPHGPTRARRRIRLAEIMTEASSLDDTVAELEEALLDAAGDAHATAETLLTLAAIVDDIALADTYSARAVATLERLEKPDPTIVSGALAQAAGARFRAGRGLDHDAFLRAIELERRHPMRRLSDRADASYAALLKYADDIDASEAMLMDLLDEARTSGDLSSIAYVLSHLPQNALWRGEIAKARGWTEEYLAVAQQGALGGHVATARYCLGWIMAYEGRLAEADHLFTESCALPAATDFERMRAHSGLGFAALSRADTAAAAAHLDQWHILVQRLHYREPGFSRAHLDYVSSLVATGRLEDTERFIDHITGLAETSGRQSTAAVATTGRALLEATTGHATEAQSTIAEALAWYDTSPLRFDRARTLLIAGRIHRRARAKRLAWQVLQEARDQFTDFGATAWIERTESELARVNLRPAAASTLTPTERRVADLAAKGLANREIAQQEFLAVKTVEANLARAYRKLGIRSRAELGLRLADMTDQP